MKNGLSAFLPLLYNTETLHNGIMAILLKIISSVSFSASEYGKGLLKELIKYIHK